MLTGERSLARRRSNAVSQTTSDTHNKTKPTHTNIRIHAKKHAQNAAAAIARRSTRLRIFKDCAQLLFVQLFARSFACARVCAFLWRSVLCDVENVKEKLLKKANKRAHESGGSGCQVFSIEHDRYALFVSVYKPSITHRIEQTLGALYFRPTTLSTLREYFVAFNSSAIRVQTGFLWPMIMLQNIQAL